MNNKGEIRISNKTGYIFLCMFLAGMSILGVFAYNSNVNVGTPDVFGHSAGEIEVNDAGGSPTGLQSALDSLYASSSSGVTYFELYNVSSDCNEITLPECGDNDGCSIRLLMQNITNNADDVKMVVEYLYMENPSKSNNNAPGIRGFTRESISGNYVWVTNTSARYILFRPWNWVGLYNYRPKECDGISSNGPAFTDPYKFVFKSWPGIKVQVYIYD